MILGLVTGLLLLPGPSLAGPWRATLDLAGGTLKFGVEVMSTASGLEGRLCNGRQCDAFSAVRLDGDSVHFELADYAASISAVARGDSLVGSYRNIGNRGPRIIPFRASRGRWPVSPAPAWLAGRWYALFHGSVEDTPSDLRVPRRARRGSRARSSATRAITATSQARPRGTASPFRVSTVRSCICSPAGSSAIRCAAPSTRVSRRRPPSTRCGPGAFTAQAAHRGDPGRHHGAIPLCVPRCERRAGARAMIHGSGARSWSWMRSAPGVPTCHEAAPVLVDLYRTRHAAGTRDRGTRVRGVGRQRSGWRTRAPLPGQVRDSLPAAAGRAPTTWTRRPRPCRNSRVHRVPHHDFHRTGWPRATSACRVLRSGHRRAARRPDCGVRRGSRPATCRANAAPTP